MDDITTLIWIGLAVIWFLTKLVRRGAKKAAGTRKRSPRPTISRPAATRAKAPRSRIESQPGFSGRDGTGPPPIVPR